MTVTEHMLFMTTLKEGRIAPACAGGQGSNGLLSWHKGKDPNLMLLCTSPPQLQMETLPLDLTLLFRQNSCRLQTFLSTGFFHCSGYLQNQPQQSASPAQDRLVQLLHTNNSSKAFYKWKSKYRSQGLIVSI